MILGYLILDHSVVICPILTKHLSINYRFLLGVGFDVLNIVLTITGRAVCYVPRYAACLSWRFFERKSRYFPEIELRSRIDGEEAPAAVSRQHMVRIDQKLEI